MSGWKRLKKGAEAELYLTQWLGLPVVVKRRVPKPYRRPDFDLQLRRARTLKEASLMIAARKQGVPVPLLLCVDVAETSLIMEYLEGPTLRDLLVAGIDVEEAMRQVGRYIGRLHYGGLVHGDLTTSNMIVLDNKVFLLDFGLGDYSASIEARGVDLHLMLRALESLVPSRAHKLFATVLKGYAEVMSGLTQEVVKRAMLVRLRGRYVEERRSQ
ncbi:MAG: Kae1-associated kinase Bud32 [Candidatus Nezhaarchaeota archaeon]|nr:Kae1-associated kinase Bud32 [Candidatus Nezhaarchaeota archaeon]